MEQPLAGHNLQCSRPYAGMCSMRKRLGVKRSTEHGEANLQQRGDVISRTGGTDARRAATSRVVGEVEVDWRLRLTFKPCTLRPRDIQAAVRSYQTFKPYAVDPNVGSSSVMRTYSTSPRGRRGSAPSWRLRWSSEGAWLVNNAAYGAKALLEEGSCKSSPINKPTLPETKNPPMKPTSQLPTKIQQGVEIRSDGRDVFSSGVGNNGKEAKGGKGKLSASVQRRVPVYRPVDKEGEGKFRSGLRPRPETSGPVDPESGTAVPVYCPVDINSSVRPIRRDCGGSDKARAKPNQGRLCREFTKRQGTRVARTTQQENVWPAPWLIRELAKLAHVIPILHSCGFTVDFVVVKTAEMRRQYELLSTDLTSWTSTYSAPARIHQTNLCLLFTKGISHPPAGIYGSSKAALCVFPLSSEFSYQDLAGHEVTPQFSERVGFAERSLSASRRIDAPPILVILSPVYDSLSNLRLNNLFNHYYGLSSLSWLEHKTAQAGFS
ncbi:hypothetical protein B0H14DRAFT_2639368 [Mycena olivaceomarginata]|nr:hypothetical protein B0H14DRAFT_2639368 [Mycena olivaceomarginata]